MTPAYTNDQTVLVQDLLSLQGLTEDENFYNVDEPVMNFRWLSVSQSEFKMAVLSNKPALEAYECFWVGLR